MIIEVYENIIIDLFGLRSKSIYLLIALHLYAIYLASSGESQLVAMA